MDALSFADRRAVFRIADAVRLVNTVSVETVDGYRSFHLLQGDVPETPCDLLVISTHALPDRPPSGEVVRRIRSRYGVSVDATGTLLRLGDWGWTCYQDVDRPAPFTGLLTLRLDMGMSPRNSTDAYERAIRGVFASVAALESLGRQFPVISMPVLAGQVLADYAAGVDSLLRHSTGWLKRSQHTHSVQQFVFYGDEIAAWNDAMNRSLGRSYVSSGQNVVLDSLRRELTDLGRRSEQGALAGAVRPLLDALASREEICIETVCVFGRKLVELIVSELLSRQQLSEERMLMNNIDQLRNSGQIAPWVISYMHALRIFGNETVHSRDRVPGYHPLTLDAGDLISALSAIRALLDFWHRHVARTNSAR